MNALVLCLVEYILWRELIYQVGCYGKDLCAGEASFGQLHIHETLYISEGKILEDDYISHAWVWILFVRVMFAMFFRFTCIIHVIVMCYWQGFLMNI